MLQESGLKNQLVHHKEGIYFAITLLVSILTYVVLLFSIIGIAMIVALMLISYFFSRTINGIDSPQWGSLERAAVS